MTEQRYNAVLAVIGDGRTVSEVATDWGVSRLTMHRRLVRYEGVDPVLATDAVEEHLDRTPTDSAARAQR